MRSSNIETLANELSDLEIRKSKLLAFIDTVEFEESHYNEQNDVYHQYEAMCDYSDCLYRRIYRLEEEENDQDA